MGWANRAGALVTSAPLIWIEWGCGLVTDTTVVEFHSLVRFLHVGAIRTLPAVVCLDGEGVLFLQLTVQLVLGPDDALASGLVQDHCLEGDILSVDPEAANLT